MGLQDRDYTRKSVESAGSLSFPTLPQHRKRWWGKVSVANALTIGALAIALVSSAIWLYRDARSTFGDEELRKGSLIVNVNTATSEQLQTIPDIGPARAAKIMAHRDREPFKAVEDLHNVKGIPRSVVDGMIPYVTVDGETHEKPSTSN
jgi:competence ComEA-like helix-hairpin-helix protein